MCWKLPAFWGIRKDCFFMVCVFSDFSSKQMRSALFWVVTQRIVVVPYRMSVPFSRVEKSNIWISSPLKKVVGESKVMDIFALKMGLLGCPETSVRNYHYTLRNNPVELISYCSLIQQRHKIRIFRCLESKVQLPAHSVGLNTVRSPQLRGTENLKR